MKNIEIKIFALHFLDLEKFSATQEVYCTIEY